MFAIPAHALNGLIGPGGVVKAGRSTARACLILMSLTDEEALPSSVAVALTHHLNIVFADAARVYHCDRRVRSRPVRNELLADSAEDIRPCRDPGLRGTQQVQVGLIPSLRRR